MSICILVAISFGIFAAYDENMFFGIAIFVMSLIAFDTLDIVHFLPITRKKRSFIFFLSFFIIFRSFFYDVMYVPSGSMTPTLLTGDYVLVQKAAYGFNKESLWPFGKLLPWLPTVQWRTPKRGDLTVWTRVNDSAFIYYVKRTVAIDGDTYQMKDGILYLNNKASNIKEMDNQVILDDNGQERLTQFFTETFPDSNFSRVTIRNTPFGMAMSDNTPLYTVPSKHFIIIGDNRTNGGSWDGRDNSAFPPMPYSQIIGKARIVLFSTTSWAHWDKNVSWGKWLVQLPARFLSTFYYLRLDRILKVVE